MSERQVQFLVPTEYIPGLVSSDHFDNQHSRLLVHTEILEDQHKEDGMYRYLVMLSLSDCQ